MRRILKVIDSISEWTGKTGRWLVLAAVVVVVHGVVTRYVFRAPTAWQYEVSWMMSGAIFVLGWCYAHRHRAHIRVDIIYSRLSLRAKAIFDSILFVLFFLPIFTMLSYKSVAEMMHSWQIGEKVAESYLYPPFYPFRTVVAIGFCFLLLQGGAQFVRDLYLAVRNKPYD